MSMKSEAGIRDIENHIGKGSKQIVSNQTGEYKEDHLIMRFT